MDASFDLDVNNYTMEDLINFFKLENTFSLEDLVKKEYELATEILSVNNKEYNPKYKFDIINFIKSAKEVLISFHNELQTVKEIEKNIKKFVNKGRDPRVGKILEPLGSHQPLEDTIIPNGNINGYNYDVITGVYVFNTTARNDYLNSQASNCTFDLPIIWKNVISLSLVSANIPNVMYAFNDESGTNQMYIEEDVTGLSGLITIPAGNYSPFKLPVPSVLPITEASFPDVLEQQINTTLGSGNRFKVIIDTSNRKTIISNNTHTFRMNFLKKKSPDRCSDYSNDIFVDYGNDYVPNKESIPLTSYFQTMGFLMGYRELEYLGNSSYPSESIFTNVYSNYIYLVLEDYTKAQTISDTYGILGPGGLLNRNILAVIPLSSGIFSTTFDNNSNFIYKKREYFGPVNISRISIKLINQKGNFVDLHKTDWDFSIQVKTIYNLTEKPKMNMRGSGFL